MNNYATYLYISEHNVRNSPYLTFAKHVPYKPSLHRHVFNF